MTVGSGQDSAATIPRLFQELCDLGMPQYSARLSRGSRSSNRRSVLMSPSSDAVSALQTVPPSSESSSGGLTIGHLCAPVVMTQRSFLSTP